MIPCPAHEARVSGRSPPPGNGAGVFGRGTAQVGSSMETETLPTTIRGCTDWSDWSDWSDVSDANDS